MPYQHSLDAGLITVKNGFLPWTVAKFQNNFDQDARIALTIVGIVNSGYTPATSNVTVWGSTVDNGVTLIWMQDASNFYVFVLDVRGNVIDSLKTALSSLTTKVAFWSVSYRQRDSTFVINENSNIFIFTRGTLVATISKPYPTNASDLGRCFNAYYNPNGDYFIHSYTNTGASNNGTIIVIFQNGSTWTYNYQTPFQRAAYFYYDKVNHKGCWQGGGNMATLTTCTVDPNTRALALQTSVSISGSSSVQANQTIVPGPNSNQYYSIGPTSSSPYNFTFSVVDSSALTYSNKLQNGAAYPSTAYGYGALATCTASGKLVRNGKTYIYTICQNFVWVVDEATFTIVKTFNIQGGYYIAAASFGEFIPVATQADGTIFSYSLGVSTP